MSEVSTNKKLKGKDLITIGIFSAIYFVINFAFMLLGGIHPVLWMLMPGFIAVFAGIPFMLMVAKVQKPGAVFLMGLITALIYFATGQFTLVILISMASTCILAEVVRMVTKYNSFKGNSIAYVIFSLGMVGSPLPIWLFKASFLYIPTSSLIGSDLKRFKMASYFSLLTSSRLVWSMFHSLYTFR